MESTRPSHLIDAYLKTLTIQQIQFLSNLKESVNYEEFIRVFKFIINGLELDVFRLKEEDEFLAIKKARLTGKADGIIFIKQLIQYAPGEMNRRMKEEK